MPADSDRDSNLTRFSFQLDWTDNFLLVCVRQTALNAGQASGGRISPTTKIYSWPLLPFKDWQELDFKGMVISRAFIL